jgi:large subunit ribosomal protein L17
MRHRNAGFKLGRNTSHRRALLRNLVTSVIMEDRVETTVAKAKAVRPLVEKMITLGKKGDLHSRRQALSFLMTDKSVERLFETVAPRYGDRQGGYLRIVRTGFQKGDGAEKAFIELLGAEKQLDAKRQKRDEIKAKKRADLEKQMEEAKKEDAGALVDALLAGEDVLGAAAGLPGVLAGFAAHLRLGLRPGQRGKALRNACGLDKVVGHVDEELKGQAEAVLDQPRGEKDRLGRPKVALRWQMARSPRSTV